MKNTTKLRKILEQEDTLLVPGCYDALSGKILKQAGFKVIYMTGSGVTTSLLGYPDYGLATMTEMVNQARNIVNCIDLPLICDADNGYGNAINVIRTVKEYQRVGVAAIHIEDQIFPKRCGHFEGKQVISAQEMVKKIEAAIYAREDEDFLLIARTDARSTYGLEEAINRGKLYFDAGAEMLFLEAPQSLEELKTIARAFKDKPLMVNIVEGGKTPVVAFEELRQMGFKIVLYPTSSLRTVAKALQKFADHLKQNGDTKDYYDNLVSFEMRNKITGLAEYQELEDKFLGFKEKP